LPCNTGWRYLNRAITLNTNSKRKAAPNCEAADIENAFNTEVLPINRTVMMRNETTALVQVTGKIIFTSVFGPDRGCLKTVGPIHASAPVKLRTSLCAQSGT